MASSTSNMTLAEPNARALSPKKSRQISVSLFFMTT
jgi:hypothetical protein